MKAEGYSSSIYGHYETEVDGRDYFVANKVTYALMIVIFAILPICGVFAFWKKHRVVAILLALVAIGGVFRTFNPPFLNFGDEASWLSYVTGNYGRKKAISEAQKARGANINKIE